LDAALDRHAELLARSKKDAASVGVVATGVSVGVGADALGEMSANEMREAGWDYPTAEMLKDLLKGRRPVLRMDGLRVRHGDGVASEG